MTNAATKPIPGVENQPKPREVSKTLMLQSGIGIRNAKSLPSKLIAILDYYYKHIDPRAGVMSIVARIDGHPKGVIGLSFPWVASFALNLQGIFDRSRIAAEKHEYGLDLRTAVWLNLLDTCLHETVHIALAVADPKDYAEYLATKDAESEKAMEELVDEISKDKLLELAKVVDIEPPSLDEMGWLGLTIMNHFIANPDDNTVRNTQKMIEKGLVYCDEVSEKYVYHNTLRSFLRNTLMKSGEDADWGSDDSGTLVRVSFEMENGAVSTVSAEPVESVEEATAEVAETIAELEKPNQGAEEPAATQVVAGQPVFVQDSGANVEADTVPEAEMVAQLFEGVAGTPEQVHAAVHGTPVQMPTDNNIAAFGMPGPAATAPVVQPVASNVASTVPPKMDQVVLPQAVVNANVNVGVSPTPQQPATALPKLAIHDRPEDMTNCLVEIYKRLYYSIFTNCGWALNAQAGSYQFMKPENIAASVDVSDILKRYSAEGLIVDYQATKNGQDQRFTCDGWIQGFMFRDKGLPAYQLTLNINGQPVQRRLVPQNPNKMKSFNAYTNGAAMARSGNAIMYIFSMAGNDQPWPVRCPAKIVNNEYQVQQ